MLTNLQDMNISSKIHEFQRNNCRKFAVIDVRDDF